MTQSTNVVSIYPGLGGGALGPPHDVEVGPNLGPIVVGDFIDDGISDIAVGIDVYVGVLEGQRRRHVPGGARIPSRIFLHRPPGGRLEPGRTHGRRRSSRLSLLLRQLRRRDVDAAAGRRSLAGGMSFLAGAGTTSFTVGDFDEDTLPDVATADQNAATMSLLFGTSSGRFIAPTYFGLTEQPIAIATGDFDGDGREDLAILDYDGTVQIARVVDGVITTGPPINAGYYQPGGLAVADFNGDQKLDVAIVSYFAVTILFGNGGGTFQPPVNVPTSSAQRFIVAGDLNGDGAPDLAFFNVDPSNMPQISTLLNDGSGNFSPGPSTPLGHNINSLVAGRFRPGLTLDLVATNGDCCGTQFDTVLSSSATATARSGAPGVSRGARAERPRRCRLQCRRGSRSPGRELRRFERGDSPQHRGRRVRDSDPVAAGFAPYLVAAGDFNSDGKMDAFASNGGQASLLLGAGGGTFQAPALYPAASVGAFIAAQVGGTAPSIVILAEESALELLFNARLSISPVLTPIVLLNQPARFSASASGFGPLSYQWMRNGTPLSDGGRISGSHTATLTIHGASFADVALLRRLGHRLLRLPRLHRRLSLRRVRRRARLSPFHGDILTIAMPASRRMRRRQLLPASPIRRDQMAAFLLKSEHGSSYVPPVCTGLFADVPCPCPFANWIEQLASEGVTSGCGGGNYCPASSVTRAQMAVFLLKTSRIRLCASTGGRPLQGRPRGLLRRRLHRGPLQPRITGGCALAPLLYCPGNAVLRQQMATFLVRTFGLP